MLEKAFGKLNWILNQENIHTTHRLLQIQESPFWIVTGTWGLPEGYGSVDMWNARNCMLHRRHGSTCRWWGPAGRKAEKSLLNWTLNKDKCVLGLKEIEILGHVISGEGIKPDPKKVEAISKAPRPENVLHLRSFLGTCDFWWSSFQTMQTYQSRLED